MRANRGFTLMELLIVIAVVAILSMIAIPSYIEYIRKGKRSEGAAALADLLMRQERYRAEHPTYGTMVQLFGTALKVTEFNNSFKYYSLSVGGSPTASVYSLTATRKGDLANDPKCGNLTVSVNAGVATKGVSSGDIAYCWRQ